MTLPTPIDAYRTPALVELLDSLALVAVEHDDTLDLTRFTALIDLYARHLQSAATGGERVERVAFERFVRDERLLARAAEAAGRDSGVPTRAPSPLGDPSGGMTDGSRDEAGGAARRNDGEERGGADRRRRQTA